MRISVFVSLILISFKGLGQSGYVKTYYPAVNKAELAITREDFTGALTFYKEAFGSVKSPFARDLFNAFVCKVLSGDFDGAKPYLFKLAQKGIAPVTLEQKEIFYLLKGKPEWENFKQVYQQICESRPQNDTRDAIVSMYNNYKAEADSVFNNTRVEVGTDVSTRVYKNHKIYQEEAKKDTTKRPYKFMGVRYLNIQERVDSLEIKYRGIVESYLKSNPWPTEDELGVENSDLSFSGNLFSQLVSHQYNTYVFDMPMPGWVLTVNTDKKKDSEFIQDQILVATREGRLSPLLASGFKMKYAPRLAELFKASVEDTTACKDFPEVASKINKWVIKRRTLDTKDKQYYSYIEEYFNMPPVEDIYQKAIYSALKNKYFIFPQPVNREETTIPSCESAISILKDARLLEEN